MTFVQDVMTPLCATLKKFDLSKINSTTDSQEICVVCEVINAVWNFIENEPEALNVFNQERIADFLVSLLLELKGEKSEMLSNLTASCLQCLYTASEENEHCWEILKSRWSGLEMKMLVERDDDEDGCFDKILFIGIAFNVHSSADTPPALVEKALGVIDKLLGMDQRKLASEYTSMCPIQGAGGEPRVKGEGEGEAMADDDVNSEDKVMQAKQNLVKVISAQKTALEILANICSPGDGDDDGWEDEEESGEVSF